MTDAAFLSSLAFPASFKGRLIVSCQAAPGDPLDDIDCLTRVAVSVTRGGAGGLRANGAESVAAFRQATGFEHDRLSKNPET